MTRSGGICDPEDGGMRKFPDDVYVVRGNSQNLLYLGLRRGWGSAGSVPGYTGAQTRICTYY